MQEFEERDRQTRIGMENLVEEKTLLTSQIENLISEHKVQIDGLQIRISDKENVSNFI